MEARQNRKLISTTATFCAIKTTARLERIRISANFRFMFRAGNGR